MGGFTKKAPVPVAPAMAAKQVTGAAKQVDEEAPTTVDTAGDTMQNQRRGKRKLRTPVTQTAGTNVGGEGSSGLQIPKG